PPGSAGPSRGDVALRVASARRGATLDSSEPPASMARASKKPREPLRIVAFLRTPPGRALGKALLVAIGALGLVLVVRQARASVERRDAYRLSPEDVVFVGLPEAADADVRRGLAESVPPVWPRVIPSTFGAGVEPRLRDALSRHPMLRDVQDVEVRFPHEVRVRATI